MLIKEKARSCASWIKSPWRAKEGLRFKRSLQMDFELPSIMARVMPSSLCKFHSSSRCHCFNLGNHGWQMYLLWEGHHNFTCWVAYNHTYTYSTLFLKDCAIIVHLEIIFRWRFPSCMLFVLLLQVTWVKELKLSFSFLGNIQNLVQWACCLANPNLISSVPYRLTRECQWSSILVFLQSTHKDLSRRLSLHS